MARLTVETKKAHRKSYTFCFYVSGHGWGHATRANQIISDILAMPAQHKVHVISNASAFIFRDIVKRGAVYRQADIDAGVVQPLPYIVDREKTIHDLEQFLLRRPQTLATEVAWLKEVKADCVVCDAPFLPCAAASRARIPAAIASNFTFDEVYSGLCEGDTLDDHINTMVKKIIEDYRHADLLIRLPGAIRIPSFDNTASLVPVTPLDDIFPPQKGVVNGKMHLPCTSLASIRKVRQDHSAFVRQIVDVPLVFRKYETEREQVLTSLGVPPHAKVLLLSFGGQALGDGSWGNPLPEGWACILCCAPDHVKLPPGFYRAPKDAYVPDLTQAADVVLGKLGYGTCSECVGHSKPFVYVSRPQFVEERGLLKLMRDQGSAVEMSREDFESGRWAEAIERAAKLSGACEERERRVGHNGGQVAARALEQFVYDWHRLVPASVDMLTSNRLQYNLDDIDTLTPPPLSDYPTAPNERMTTVVVDR